jgi:hypothetical protein
MAFGDPAAAPVITLVLIAAAVWFWIGSMRAREQTLARARRACEQMDVQLLDQTVALSRLWVRRDSRGHLRLWRWYSFEFSISGSDRHRGAASLVGDEIQFVRLEHPEGPVIITGQH